MGKDELQYTCALHRLHSFMLPRTARWTHLGVVAEGRYNLLPHFKPLILKVNKVAVEVCTTGDLHRGRSMNCTTWVVMISLFWQVLEVRYEYAWSA